MALKQMNKEGKVVELLDTVQTGTVNLNPPTASAPNNFVDTTGGNYFIPTVSPSFVETKGPVYKPKGHKKWEYKTLRGSGERDMNAMGEEGWEALFIVNGYVYFKREVI